MRLSAPTGGATLGVPASASVALLNFDLAATGTVQFSNPTYTVSEGAGSISVNVTRVGGSAGIAEVVYTANDGTAVAGLDYTAVSGLLHWADGESATKTIIVPVLEDALVEGDETFAVRLSAPAGRATLGTPSVATVTITDNDVAPPGTLQFTNAAVTVSEGVGILQLTVVRLGGTNGTVGVSYAATNGTAVVFEDYLPATGTLQWAAGDDAPQYVRIPIIDDGRVESEETFTVTLSAPTGGAALGTPTAVTVTIVDNDTNAPPAGNFAWVVRAAATNATVSKVVSDAAGNLYAAGYFSGTLQLGSQTFTSSGARADAWVTKLDGAGNVVWAKSYGSTGDDRAQGITVDGSGNVVVVGRFSGTVNFGGTNVTGLGLPLSLLPTAEYPNLAEWGLIQFLLWGAGLAYLAQRSTKRKS